MDYREEMKQLRDFLNQQSYLYYVLDAPVIPDYEYDRLNRRLEDLVAHPLGGGVRGDLLRVLRLQLLQAAEHVVVVVVGHGGVIQHVVAVARLVEGAAQLRHLAFVVHSAPPEPNRGKRLSQPLFSVYS